MTTWGNASMKKVKNTNASSEDRRPIEASSPAAQSNPGTQSQLSSGLQNSLRVLYCTAEAQPLVEIGGLGEVGGALPPALRELGADVRLLIPAYHGVIDTIRGEPVGEPCRVLPGVQEPVQLFQGTLVNGQPVYAIACPSLYDREGGPFSNADGDDWPDNALRFGVLSKVAALFGNAAGLAGWAADIIHCNDWHTGLAPAYLMHDRRARARSVISIHNIAFQGNCSPELLSRALLAYQDKKTWQKIQNNGMLKEFGWAASAARYLKIYQALVPGGMGPQNLAG
jgi:glycogen synthase